MKWVSMKPFQGITFCPTAISDEESLRSISKKIVKLGGIFSKDLTKNVNVLVVGKTANTSKYKFAVKYRFDMIFINADALEQLYQLWLSGEDVTQIHNSSTQAMKNQSQKIKMLNVLHRRYRYKPLTKYQIFIGRIGDGTEVEHLEKICNEMGVTNCNSKHFVKDCRPTMYEPIVFVTDIKRGARVDAARQQKLPVIHHKWLLDCNKRGALLEYDPFYLLDNVSENDNIELIGNGSCECWDKLQFNTFNNQAEALTDSLNIRSTILEKFKPKGEKLWEKAMSRDDSKLSNLIKEEVEKSSEIITADQAPSLFDKCNFILHVVFSTNQRQILVKVITNNGGKIVEDSFLGEGENTFFVVPSNVPLNELSIPTSSSYHLTTEFFIERCLHYKNVILPIDTWSRPFYYTKQFMIEPNNKLLHESKNHLNVAITGFHGVELLHLLKILELMKPMGINYTKILNKSTDVLLINLSTLLSIPTSHPLWQNQYNDLFIQQNDDYLKSNDNQVFRNSMKKKIEFIKEKHSIPVVTPAFIFQTLYKTKNTEDEASIHLNNINWCVICPRGKKDDFSCQIKFTKKPEDFEKKISSAVELDNHIDDEFSKDVESSSSNLLNLGDTKFADTALSNNDKDTLKRKRLEPNQELKPVKRTSSWGKIISESVKDVPKSLKIADSVIEETGTSESPELQPEQEIAHTQITYGTAKNVPTTKRPTRKLTRTYLKEIDL